jgi:hypothetical protein
MKGFKFEVQRLKDENESLQTLRDQETFLNGMKEGLIVRELELDKRERELKMEIMGVKLHCSEEKLHAINQLVEKVFGLPSVSVSTYTNKPIIGKSYDGASESELGRATEDSHTTTTQGKGNV